MSVDLIHFVIVGIFASVWIVATLLLRETRTHSIEPHAFVARLRRPRV
jgi:hypothetical protein